MRTDSSAGTGAANIAQQACAVVVRYPGVVPLEDGNDELAVAVDEFQKVLGGTGHGSGSRAAAYCTDRRRAATTRPSAEDARSPTLTESPPTLRSTTTAVSVSGSTQAAAR